MRMGGGGTIDGGGSQRDASGYSEKCMNSDDGPSYKVCHGGDGDNARPTTAGGARREGRTKGITYVQLACP